MQSNGGSPQNGKSQTQKPLITEIVLNVVDKLVQVMALIPLLLEQLTGRWRILFYGLGTVYFTLLNTESYYTNIVADARPYLPKPFIADNANFADLFSIVFTNGFWFAAMFSLLTTAITAQWYRDRQTLQEAKRDYEEVKSINLGEEPKDSPDFVIHKRRRFKRAGMKKIRMMAGIFFVAVVTDIASSLAAFPPIGSALLVNLVWATLSSFGSEFFYVLTSEAWEEMKLFPRIQVVK